MQLDSDLQALSEYLDRGLMGNDKTVAYISIGGFLVMIKPDGTLVRYHLEKF